MDRLQRAVEQIEPFATNGGASPADLDAIEAALGVTLPPDVRPIAAVFRGGAIGEKFFHFSWSPVDSPNVIERTRHFRAQGLPTQCVALAVSGRLLHALDYRPTTPMVRSFVLAAAERPDTLELPLREQDRIYFFSYAGFLLDRIETLRYVPVRAALLKRFKDCSPTTARRWRHRWDPSEVRRIADALKRGITPGDRLPTHVVAGVEYTDLRGFPVPPALFAHDSSAGPLHERIDFSFADGSFFGIHAHQCLFRGARMSCAKGRFRNCDFTLADVEHSNNQCLGADFADCDFTGAYLAGCSMFGRYERCDFTRADLYLAPLDLEADGGAAIDCTLTDARVSGDFGPWGDLKGSAAADRNRPADASPHSG